MAQLHAYGAAAYGAGADAEADYQARPAANIAWMPWCANYLRLQCTANIRCPTPRYKVHGQTKVWSPKPIIYFASEFYKLHRQPLLA